MRIADRVIRFLSPGNRRVAKIVVNNDIFPTEEQIMEFWATQQSPRRRGWKVLMRNTDYDGLRRDYLLPGTKHILELALRMRDFQNAGLVSDIDFDLYEDFELKEDPAARVELQLLDDSEFNERMCTDLLVVRDRSGPLGANAVQLYIFVDYDDRYLFVGGYDSEWTVFLPDEFGGRYRDKYGKFLIDKSQRD